MFYNTLKNKQILGFSTEPFKFYFYKNIMTRSIISIEIQKERFEEVDR